jgi:hypothetical protein
MSENKKIHQSPRKSKRYFFGQRSVPVARLLEERSRKQSATRGDLSGRVGSSVLTPPGDRFHHSRIATMIRAKRQRKQPKGWSSKAARVTTCIVIM